MELNTNIDDLKFLVSTVQDAEVRFRLEDSLKDAEFASTYSTVESEKTVSFVRRQLQYLGIIGR